MENQWKNFLDIALDELCKNKTIKAESLKKNFDKAEFYKYENNIIYYVVTDSLTQFTIDKFYSNALNEILAIHTFELPEGKCCFKFITEEQKKKDQEKASIASTEKVDFDRSTRKLRAEFNFNNFVVGDSNRFAYTQAIKVAESPNAIFNPLYIFGDVGLGKTHLMMAIGHYILDKDLNTNVLYTTASQFAEDYFIATNTEKGKKNIEAFYDKYRKIDVLLVDDIQLLENKKSTQEEFFKVFDYLHENNKQIVVTSDRPAKELQIMARLRTRFEWGLVVDIKSPGKDLRLKILQKKLDFLVSNPKTVPIECLDFICDNFSNNIRELEGALRRFVTYCVSFNIPFTLENAQISLEGLLSSESNQSDDTKNEEIIEIKKVVSSYFKISLDDLSSSKRNQQIVYARNLCFYIIRKRCGVSLKKLGDFFGNRDHATVAHSIDKIEKQVEQDFHIKSDINYIESKLEKQKK